MLKLYNSLSKTVETFKSLRKGKVRLYTCGPTVYNYAHIGNFRTFLFEDVLERALEWSGYRVRRVMNITDVGHLTGDSDTGEDKIDREAKKEKKTVAEVVRFYTKAFLRDARKLNIRIPKILAPATKFVPNQIEIIQILFEKGFAYETAQAVYFDVSKFKNYGKLSGQSLKEKLVAARGGVVADPEKRNPADFALWFKRVGKFKNHLLRWDSPWGPGFPGWHIECSTISRHFLGQPFDIHTGGVDHIGTHHTNEIAQSEGAFGKPLARYWLHGEHLIIESQRMGKSEGNFVTLREVERRGFNPLSFRYLVLQSHYRTKVNFTWESLEAADRGLKNLYQEIRRLAWTSGKRTSEKNDAKAEEKYNRLFTEAVNNDLNTPRALVVLQTVIGTSAIGPQVKLRLVKAVDEVLGLGLEIAAKTSRVPAKVRKLVVKRESYRKNKQFIQSDRLRKEIHDLGYVVEDTNEGPSVWQKNLS